MPSGSSTFTEEQFPATPVSLVQPILDSQNTLFSSGTTNPLSWRKHNLTQLLKLLLENIPQLQRALLSDLGKCADEGSITEIEVLINETREAIHELPNWAAPTQVASPLLLAPAFCEVRRVPRGPILIIAPFNYPVSLSLGPLVSSLAGGNPTVIKPSELCPAVAKLLEDLVRKYFDPSVVNVVNGGIPQTTALLR